MIHDLKIQESFAEAVVRGDKTFDLRYNDRGFQKGDLIRFHAVTADGLELDHPINQKLYLITYVLNGWGLDEYHVALAIAPWFAEVLK